MIIAGYFGSGAQGHPNKGYLLFPPLYGQQEYSNQNFPGSVQTQVTGLNDHGTYVGFWSSSNNADLVNANFGWYAQNGVFHEVNFPTSNPASPPVDQLLGVDNNNVAVGFYTGDSNNHGYEYNIRTHTFSAVTIPVAGVTSLTATSINNYGDVAGFYVNPTTGNTDGFLLTHAGQFFDLAVSGAFSTMALGVNDHDEVVGATTPNSNLAELDGITWTPTGGFTTLDDPNGVGTTTITGVNNAGDLVGFYVDSNGNTDGILAAPKGTTSYTRPGRPRGGPGFRVHPASG